MQTESPKPLRVPCRVRILQQAPPKADAPVPQSEDVRYFKNRELPFGLKLLLFLLVGVAITQLVTWLWYETAYQSQNTFLLVLLNPFVLTLLFLLGIFIYALGPTSFGRYGRGGTPRRAARKTAQLLVYADRIQLRWPDAAGLDPVELPLEPRPELGDESSRLLLNCPDGRAFELSCDPAMAAAVRQRLSDAG